MPRFISTPRRTALPPDTRPRLPSAAGPKPAVISRTDTVVELRAIYALLRDGQTTAAQNRLTTLGRNLNQ